MKSSRTRAALILATAASALFVAACNPTLRTHGFRYTDNEVPELTPGEDTQSSVLATLGNPSTRGVFETDTWYYISATRDAHARARAHLAGTASGQCRPSADRSVRRRAEPAWRRRRSAPRRRAELASARVTNRLLEVA